MAMTMELFRSEVAKRRGGRRKGAPRYPDEMRVFAVAHGRAALAQGRVASMAASELGIDVATLAVWMRSSTQSRLRPVEVVQKANVSGPATLTWTTPTGHAITGLSVATAAELLRALS